MDEQRAHRVVDALRERGIDARMEKAGVYQFGIAVQPARRAGRRCGTATAPWAWRRR